MCIRRFKFEDAAAITQIYHLAVQNVARRFFPAKEFSVAKRQDFKRNGVQIHNYRMENCLDLST